MTARLASPRRASLRSAWLPMLLLAAPVSAQRPEPERLSPLIDSLGAELLAAERALYSARELAQAERIARAQTPLDTQLVGPVTVISRSEIADLARFATQRALARFGPLSDDRATPLRAQTLLIEYGRPVPEFMVMSEGGRVDVVTLPTLAPPASMADAVARRLARELTRLLPEDLRTWAGGAVAFQADRDVLASTYRELSITSSPAGVRCRQGDVAGCASALDLTGPGEFWSDWYSETELLAWARSRTSRWQRSPEFSDCFERRVSDACASLRAQGRGPAAPLSGNARLTLIAVALEHGEAAGFRVLRGDTSGTVLERLARAAGMPADELLGEWRRRVDEARPQQAAGLNGSWLATLAWAALLCAFAMRSTRWRLG